MSDQSFAFCSGMSVGAAIALGCIILLGFLHRDRGNSGIYQTRRDPKQSSATFKPPQGGSGTAKPASLIGTDANGSMVEIRLSQGQPFVCTYCMREFPDKNWTKPCPHFGEA